MEYSSGCEEILENIKLALHRCSNNKSVYNINNVININECANIQKFANSLYSTETKIKLFQPQIENMYSIEYIVKDRTLIIDK